MLANSYVVILTSSIAKGKLTCGFDDARAKPLNTSCMLAGWPTHNILK